MQTVRHFNQHYCGLVKKTILKWLLEWAHDLFKAGGNCIYIINESLSNDIAPSHFRHNNNQIQG